MATTFRAPAFLHIGNRVMGALVRAGLPVGGNVLLTVRGRKSGLMYTNPVTIVKLNGNRYLIAVYGISNWVQNLRASGTGTITRIRRTETIVATELTATDAAPILKQGLAMIPFFLRRYYYQATPTSSLDDFAREAVNHPVFLLSRGASQA